MILESIRLVLFVVLAYLLIYKEVSVAVLYKKAKETATGAGLAFLGLCLLILGIIL